MPNLPLGRERLTLMFLEVVVLAAVVALALCVKRLDLRFFRRIERGLGQVARRRVASIALTGLLGFTGCSLVALLWYFPQPMVHDEFSYLLAADTFAHGRVTNPTHPMWPHFESFHIIHQPTYNSKYPPAQGLFLALGQALAGHPAVGLWISIGLMCAAIHWMLVAWAPPAWALLGGLLAVARWGVFGYWSHSYWGGAVAALGGALLFGALRRLIRRPRASSALVMALGLAILANSRPFEGLIVSIPAAVVLLVWMLHRNGPPAGVSTRRIVLPVLVVLVATGTAMAYYNFRVTGNVLRTPYEVYSNEYLRGVIFTWQPYQPAPTLRHEAMRKLYELPRYRNQRSDVRSTLRRVRTFVNFYFGILLATPLLLAFPWVIRNRWMLFAMAICGLSILGLIPLGSPHVHYQAPVTGLAFALALRAMRHLRLWRWRTRPVGGIIVWAIPLVTIASLGVAIAQQTPVDASSWHLQRARIMADLTRSGGRHLVIVRYGPRHSLDDEWVYNQADIDGSRVVWAREMDWLQNDRLIEYFKDRQVWLLEADIARRTLAPYPR